MSARFEAVEVQGGDVFWVGAVDWNLRDFHGYTTHRGTTYNAYLILGESGPVLVDTVKAPFFDEMMARIASVTDPGEIELIVSNHSEMDHSGSLPRTVAATGASRLLVSRMGQKALAAHFGDPGCEVVPVSDGEETPLAGNRAIFLETRMLHWPDSMFTVLPDRRLLFSQDAFGMHLASSMRFDDEMDNAIMEEEAAAYYANILLPYSPLVGKLLEKVRGSGLSFDIIAPDHGPIWRSDPSWIVGRYSGWSKGCSGPRVVVVYDTMWGSTAGMARAIGEGASVDGVEVRVLSMGSSHRSDVATALLGASALLAGSPTLNNDLLPSMADLLTYLRGLKPTGLVGDAFGSYGWSGESVARLRSYMQDMSVDLLGDGIRVQYVPDQSALAACRDLGKKTADRIREINGRAG